MLCLALLRAAHQSGRFAAVTTAPLTIPLPSPRPTLTMINKFTFDNLDTQHSAVGTC